MDFDRCPECGETNFEQDPDTQLRAFECGFSSELDRRHSRCDSPRCRQPIQRAMLIESADQLAEALEADGIGPLHVARARQLARQLRLSARDARSDTSPTDPVMMRVARTLGAIRWRRDR